MSEAHQHVFPPALISVLRTRVKGGCLQEVDDDVLGQLLTTIFWAGMETYEGERAPIGVAFLGTSPVDFVIPEGVTTGTPLYQWKILRFDPPRPFNIPELVKLSVAGGDRRMYSAVNACQDGSLVIAGLAREGFNVDPDPFVTIVTVKPGCLAVRSGKDLLLAYERGNILTGGEDVVFSAGPVRRALETMARAEGFGEPLISDYLSTVRALVGEMTAHGHGGILIVSLEQQPDLPKTTTYKMAMDASLSSLLRLTRRLDRTKDSDQAPGAKSSDIASGGVLRNAFLTEAERITEELGALTAIDGATVINRSLALVAFGVMLPLGRPSLAEADDAEGLNRRPLDLGTRGTRHHAGITYAAQHPGSVVFVASEDGQVSCMFRDPSQDTTLLWRLRPGKASL